MLDEIVNELKGKVGNSLIEKVGLTGEESDKSLKAAGTSVMDVVGGGDGIDLGDVLTLFSNKQNTNGADKLMDRLGETFQNKLRGDVGLRDEKASSVRDMVLPLLMNFLSDKVGGDGSALSSLMGNAANGLLGGNAKGNGILGSVNKLFGK